jgi:hypothetical protein
MKTKSLINWLEDRALVDQNRLDMTRPDEPTRSIIEGRINILQQLLGKILRGEFGAIPGQ